MAGGINKLGNEAVKAWIKRRRAGVPGEKSKLFDGHGLFLTLTPQGTPVWRLRYRFGLNADGSPRDRILSLGAYPELSLASARIKRDEARALLASNRDPVMERRAARTSANASAGITFRSCAEDWLALERGRWEPTSYETAKEQIERHVSRYIGDWPIQSCDAAACASVLRRILDPKAERGVRKPTAERIAFWGTQIFRLAKTNNKFVGDNPFEDAKVVLRGAKNSPGKRAAVLTWSELGDVLRRAETAHLSPAVRMAHRLCAFTAMRPGNVIAAEWSEFNLEGERFVFELDASSSESLTVPTWRIPRSKMKVQDRKGDHLVILGPVITAELRTWHGLSGAPRTGFLFPALAGKGDHITSEAMSKAYRTTMGLADKHSPHGWRAAFTTLAAAKGHNESAVEVALDHAHGDRVKLAYDRWNRMKERIEIARWWNEQLSIAQGGTP